MTSSRNHIATIRLSLLTLVLVLVHEALAYGLNRLELIERLLSPGDPGVVLVLFLGVAFFALRLGLFFVLPGVWLFVAIREARATTNRTVRADTSQDAASHRARH
jgi:hypothetical protein